ncbi:hypothetical protein ACSFA3_00355 [Variovorax sp. RHLX14]|uniref:hypothetical protein n=1 Tax=Variovorax sp. RHLX14 TaxID=1259731 RepID=UPI003F48FD4A
MTTATTATTATTTTTTTATSGGDAVQPAAQTPVAVATSSPLLALAKTAAGSAPTSVAAIPTRAGPAPTLLASGFIPSWPYQRYWLSGDGRNNGSGTTADNPRLDTVAFIYNFAKWAKRPAGISNNFNDGSKADYWTTGADYGNSPAYIGIRTNSRYVAMPSQSFCYMSLVVDGKIIVPGVDYKENNQYAVWDLGTNADRNLVFVGDSGAWISEVVIETGATIAPYDFTASQPVTMSFTGDSFLGHQAIEETGLSFIEMQARLLGASATTATHIGGSGYRADTDADPLTRASSAPRMARFTEAKPTIMMVELGINDPWPGTGPTTTESMKTVLQGARTANPDGVLVVLGPWGPKEFDATNVNGTYIARMNAISAIVETLPGPWVVLDNLRGSWKTSKGTVRGAVRGPWQTGNGNAGAPTGIGNGDTWLNADGVHPSTPVGITGLAEVLTFELRAALASM